MKKLPRYSPTGHDVFYSEEEGRFLAVDTIGGDQDAVLWSGNLVKIVGPLPRTVHGMVTVELPDGTRARMKVHHWGD